MTVHMSDLDSIWDDDAVVTRRPQAQSEQEPLFLPEEEEEVPQIDIDVDKIFSGVDTDEFTLEPLQRIDIEAEQRAAEKRRKRDEALSLTPHEVLPSSSPPRDTGDAKGKAKDNDGDKKERRKILVLDEGRLISDDGFPRLIKDTKHFRIKGKGHEATDLHRLLQVYQYWTHRLYPRTQFKDTVERVEKLCHSRRMQSRLSAWRDEVRGKKTSPEADEDVIDLTENRAESDSSAPPTRPPSSMSEGGNDDDNTVDIISNRKSTARRVVDDDDDDDFMLGAFDESAAETAPVSNEPTPAVPDDEEMWSMVEELERETPSTKTSTPAPTADEDEDMWNILSELEAEAAKKTAPSVATAPTTIGQQTDHQSTGARSFVEEDADDMYL